MAEPVRYRIIGMDCARDAAEIERAAREAGFPGGTVRVSAATHVMTVVSEDAALSSIERAVTATGYSFERIAPGTPASQAHATPGYRRALLIVVVLNVGFGVIEALAGYLAGSQAVLADALDFLGDGSITLLGLIAIGWSTSWRARTAMLQGVFLALLGLGVLGGTLWRVYSGGVPDAGIMGLMGVFALAVNIAAVLPLLPYRSGDANMRAVWLFSRNDAIGNAAIIGAAGLVAWTGRGWPDLVVAAAIAALFLHSAVAIIVDARRDLGR